MACQGSIIMDLLISVGTIPRDACLLVKASMSLKFFLHGCRRIIETVIVCTRLATLLFAHPRLSMLTISRSILLHCFTVHALGSGVDMCTELSAPYGQRCRI